MASSAKRRKELRKARERRLAREVQHPPVQPSATGVRMSDVVQHLAEPIVEELGDTIDDLELIIKLTVAAWNLTHFAPDMQGRQFERLSAKFFGSNCQAIAMFRWICDIVAERKRVFYPHLNAVIVDVYFTHESTSSLYFEVAYSMAQTTALRS